MISETGRVVAIERDALWVETIRSSTCGSCVARKGCGHGLLNRIRDGQRGLVRVLPGDYSPGSCRINDQVRIGIPEEVILRGSLVVYMLPLVAMLAAAALSANLWPSAADTAAIAGAVAGFLAGLAVVRLHAWYHRSDPHLQPVLVGIMASADTAGLAPPP